MAQTHSKTNEKWIKRRTITIRCNTIICGYGIAHSIVWSAKVKLRKSLLLLSSLNIVYVLLTFNVYGDNKGYKHTFNIHECVHLYNTIFEPLKPMVVFLITDSKYRYLKEYKERYKQVQQKPYVKIVSSYCYS